MAEAEKSGWGPRTVEHEFSTGRVATLRRAPNIYAMATTMGMVDVLLEVGAGDGTDQERQRELEERTKSELAGEAILAILQSYFVKPRILGVGEPRMPNETEADACRWEDLETEEIDETITLWKEAAMKARRFRGDAAGAGGGANGEVVGDKPGKAARPRPRKRAGAAG